MQMPGELRLRSATFADLPETLAMHARCSPASLRSRYHADGPHIPPRWVARLLVPRRGAALLAVRPDPRGDHVVGMGQLIFMPTPGTAEIALLVEDAWQHRGVGSALLRGLVAAAGERGLTLLSAWCLPERAGLHRAARRAGLAVLDGAETGVLHIPVPALF
ncbi:MULTISPECIES: GNAT family N-acetyltransferase [unclassified Crossiella]|uniref:GNAT family N-acetyltransferase n=1 Tax=unclassified Crossiella TaxID=2620835 RepID=UPI001FFF2692|nr:MULTISPECIES: GNAT family N-acetyltransferase [unclassified Crossiella]MCK2243343.1 GNAT family N-acetyltransferase [Crossiella sp. S99.2]MCK2254188.1 GNAT family N-acetyltransferase [Crossiella sp. S99.1]